MLHQPFMKCGKKWKKNQINHAAGHMNLRLLLLWWTEEWWLRVRNKVPKHQVNAKIDRRMLFCTYLKSKWSPKRILYDIFWALCSTSQITAEKSKVECLRIESCKILYNIEHKIAVYVLMKQMFPSMWHAIGTVKSKTFTASKPTNDYKMSKYLFTTG